MKAPKVPEKILEPADTGDIQRLLTTCDKDYTGQRDRAIILTLLDTGVRAAELSMAFGTAPSG